MVIYIRRRSITIIIASIILLGISFGAFHFALHPNMGNWKRQKLVITDIKTDKKVVSLTFDDGPDPVNTPLILDALKRNEAKATFFVLGIRAEKHPKLLQRMVIEGHEIGNHSFTHPDFNDKSQEFMLNEIRKTNETIYRITGQIPTLFRPPGGYLSYDLVDLTKNENITIAYWTYQQDSKDWRGIKARQIADHIIKNIAPGQIIILHDGAPNGIETAKALDILIPELKEKGYELIPMGELIKMGNKE